MGEDALLQLLQFRSGLDADAVQQRLAGGQVGGQGLASAPCPVERQHELPAQPLPRWKVQKQTLEDGNCPLAPTRAQQGLHPLFLDLGATGGAPTAAAAGFFVRDIVERPAAPQLEGALETVQLPAAVAEQHQIIALLGQLVEPQRVGLVGIEDLPVASYNVAVNTSDETD